MTESKINDSGLETFETNMMAFIHDQRFDHQCSDNGNIYNNPFTTTQQPITTSLHTKIQQ